MGRLARASQPGDSGRTHARILRALEEAGHTAGGLLLLKPKLHQASLGREGHNYFSRTGTYTLIIKRYLALCLPAQGLIAGGHHGFEGLKLLARPTRNCCLQGFPSGESEVLSRNPWATCLKPKRYKIKRTYIYIIL